MQYRSVALSYLFEKEGKKAKTAKTRVLVLRAPLQSEEEGKKRPSTPYLLTSGKEGKSPVTSFNQKRRGKKKPREGVVGEDP